MRMLHPWVIALAISGCAVEDAGSAGRSITPHLELYGPVYAAARDLQAQFYETYLAELERFLAIGLPRIRLYETSWPRACAAPYCVQGDALVVLCHDLRRECMLALSTALVDQLRDMPLVFREGLADALAGGLGHGDVLDLPIARDALDLPTMLDDPEYRAAKAAALQVEFGDLAWLHGTVYPAGDFVRYVFDRRGPVEAIRILTTGRDRDAWAVFGGLDAAIAGWRASRQRHGRSYRFALAECSDTYALDAGQTLLPVMIQGVAFAPDLVSSIDRFGVGNFDVVSDAQASVRIASAFDGHPFVRLEACDGDDPDHLAVAFPDAHTVVGAAGVHRGRYFVLGGSDRVPTPTLGEAIQPEPIEIHLAPQSSVLRGSP